MEEKTKYEIIDRAYSGYNEFKKAQKENGPELVSMAYPYAPRLTVLWCNDKGVIIPDSTDGFKQIFVSYEDLMGNYAWANGTICAVRDFKGYGSEPVKGEFDYTDNGYDRYKVLRDQGLTDEQMTVMIANAQGNIIEERELPDGEWKQVGYPNWDWKKFEYRVIKIER